MQEHSFSIVIPFGKRPDQLIRAVNSILAQTYQNWELIIVNDGASQDILTLLPKDERIRIFHQEHLNRVYAQNLGLREAKNEWMCLLDSDDSYINTYLEICNQSINEFPDYKLFNFGSMVFRAKGTRAEQFFGDTSTREPFEHEDHERFSSGKIAQGSFIFHRDAYGDVGELPASPSPYYFSDAMKEKFPEMKEWYGDLYMKGGKEIGNPWGNDYALYYMLTRKYKHKVIPFYLYIQYAHL